jgi:hypothetical protein
MSIVRTSSCGSQEIASNEIGGNGTIAIKLELHCAVFLVFGWY